jgi:feruloyl esterase
MSHVWAQQVQAMPGAAFRPEQISFLQQEVLKQCDQLDGLADGLIDDPPMCRVDVGKLLCANNDSPQCFSAPQAMALQKLYAGPPKSGRKRVAFALPASGAEAGRPVPFLGWDGFVAAGGKTPPQQVVLANGTLQELMSPPLPPIAGFDWKTDPAKLTAGLSGVLDVQPNLSRYFARGGKLIIYHGWADAAIPPEQTIAFYRSMLQQSGKRAARSSRLFLIPGMQHCFGGAGRNCSAR